MSLFVRINEKVIGEKREPLSDKEKYYKDSISKKAKELGYKGSREFETSVDRGIKAVDKKPTGKKVYPRVGYATGEPFQPDNNPATVKTIRGKTDPKTGEQGPPVKVPGTGKFPATGKGTLRGRFRYPSMDKDFSSAVKTGEVERDVASRLKTRLGYTAKDELGDIKTPEGKKNIDTFVSKVMKNQKGTIGTGKGKDSDLYKILKRDVDNRNPTVPSKVINPETGTRFRNPAPGGFDAEGGRTGTKAQQNRYDARAQSAAKRFDKEIVKQTKLPKDLEIPKGGSGDSTPLAKKELNVKYKAAKLKLDYGGRFVKKASKDELAKIDKELAQSKTFASRATKAPQRFSTYKYDRNNVVSTGLKGRTAPKFKDKRNTIAYRVDRKPGQRIGFDTFKDPSKVKFTRLKTKSTSVKPTFSDVFKRNATRAATKPIRFARNNPYTAIGLSLAAAPFVNNKVQNMLFNKRQNEKLKNFKPKYPAATKTDMKNLFK